MSLSNTLNHPNWRYKLIWLGVSAAVSLALWHSGSAPDAVTGLACISTGLAAGVITWYAILVGAEKLVAAYFAGRDSRIGPMDKIVVVWVTTAGACAPCVWILSDQWPQVLGSNILLGVFVMLVVFVAMMRSMDLRDDSATIVTRPVARAAHRTRPRDRQVGHPAVGLGNEFIDADTITIEDVPTKIG